MTKPLNSQWVVVSKSPTTPFIPSTISSPKRGSDIIQLFTRKNNSPTSRLSIRKAATALDKVAIEIIIRDREIQRLQAQLDQAKPPKRRKVVQDPNERFTSLAQILAQANQEPRQRIRKTNDTEQAEESSCESDEEPTPTRRSARERRPTKRYLERDSDTGEEGD